MWHSSIGILAGEASGDILGSGLMSALQQHDSSFQFTGIGGQGMLAAGLNPLFAMERLSVMGIVEVLPRLPELLKMRWSLLQYYKSHKPNVFIGIDAPDFNLTIEAKLRKLGIPTVHYVSPSVWAWRKRRIHKIAKAADLILTLFPFEAAFYEKHQIPACFVGHPLADIIPLQPDKLAARKQLQLAEDVNYIAVLPGSRRNEIRYLAEAFVKAAYLCWQERPHLQFITSAANKERNLEFQQYCHQLAPNLPIQFFENATHNVLAAADVVLVASGTATLETLLFKRPMVIAYRMAELTYKIAKHLVTIPYVGLPNILADKKIVPEFIQDAVQPNKLAEAILNFLDSPNAVSALQEKFLTIHHDLRCNGSLRAAKAVLSVMR